ncbi:MAG: hypothetical protein FJX78_05045, partial [Armatimonadetes bacterium]|nr:hypothetical protein [Armatimonadota bacterium]
MPSPSLDVARAHRMMREQGIDVLLVVAPENFQYTTGVVTLLPGFRHSGVTSIVVLPADERLSPAAIVGDTEARAIRKQSWIEDVRTHPLWIESDDITEAIAANPEADALAALAAVADRKPARRAAEIDMTAVTAQVVAALVDRKLERARIGTEFEDIPASELHRFQRALPNATFVDATSIFRELRLIKTNDEIDKLRTAAEIAEAAMTTAVRDIGADTKVGDVFRAFQIEAIKIVSRRGADAITHYELGRANI